MGKNQTTTGRRNFLKTVALATGAASSQAMGVEIEAKEARNKQKSRSASAPSHQSKIEYPRTFSGRQLQMLAFPIGGIGTGCISLGGRGQLRDWEIFNRPNKGYSPEYAFACIWVQSGNAKPVARVLEARFLPPYQAARGLGPDNAPGLQRFESATFIGEYPLAKVVFHDSEVPVNVVLEGFNPMIPLETEDSGLPIAILRYRVSNPGKNHATVSIAFSLDNPVGVERHNPVRASGAQKRVNEHRKESRVEGLFMRNPSLPETDPLAGSVALGVLNAGTGKLTVRTGWPSAKWWASPMIFWDQFSSDGKLGPETSAQKPTGSVCLSREIRAGEDAEYTFLLSWHFPNRTPEWCGWLAPKGEENTIIGNHYCTRFRDAWHSAEYAAEKLPALESRMRQFIQIMQETTLPPVVKDAAMSNLSTLVTQTCFRTADGEFHGFEGCDDQRGCCFGNCTHVWNYETATQFLFPTLARSLRKAAFGYSADADGGMRHRQLLPDGKQRYGYAAADGQMGQIIKAYLDWRLSGDKNWLQTYWPKVKKGLDFAWISGGWDADRDGVMEGVQHNTYDVEFYGPNPQCGIYYLGALRAGEEMAKVIGDTQMAQECHRLFLSGSEWIDSQLFNGEYYIQKIRNIPRESIAPATVSDMGSDRSDKPEFQLGEGCLVDQLVGQYLAEVAGLGALLDPAKVRKTLESIYRYNYKRNLYDHYSVQRVFALNDEAALVICDYGKGKRPEIPFPYFAEVMTGFEYSAAILMLYTGMVTEGVECIENIRRRYDGERRNPWDEAECGHHYARAMAAWSAIPALSGFRYDGEDRSVVLAPRIHANDFSGFWSMASSWGSFSLSAHPRQIQASLSVSQGTLALHSVSLTPKLKAVTTSFAKIGTQATKHHVRPAEKETCFTFPEEIKLKSGERLNLAVSG
jgi:non-lysosomal glucosylceramidase